MAITLKDLERAVLERGGRKTKKPAASKEDVRAIIASALADQPGQYMDRERFLRGQGPDPEAEFGFSGQLARERGLGYGQPREPLAPAGNRLRDLVSQLEGQQGVASSTLPAVGAEVLEDPTLTASADPVPTGSPAPPAPVATGGPVPREIAEVVGQKMAEEEWKGRGFLDKLFNLDKEELDKEILSMTNRNIRREALARGVPEDQIPTLTRKQVAALDRDLPGGFAQAAAYANPYSKVSPTPAGGTKDPATARLYESENIKRQGQAETQQWLERFDNEPLAQFQAYQESDVGSRIAQEAGPEVAQQIGLVLREHGGDPADLYQRLQLLMQGGNDPEEAFADLSNYAASKRQKRKMNYLISRGLAKYDPLTQQ